MYNCYMFAIAYIHNMNNLKKGRLGYAKNARIEKQLKRKANYLNFLFRFFFFITRKVLLFSYIC